jgi:hypothetical protein
MASGVTKLNRVLGACVVMLVAPPLLAALLQTLRGAALAYPSGDWALLQIDVHEAVKGALVLGPYSRFGWHHPGPLLPYVLVPGYWLSGHAPASLHVTAALLSFTSLLVASFAWFRVARQPAERLLFVVILALHSMNFAVGLSGSGHAEVWNPVVGVMPFTALLVVCVGVVAGAPGLLPLAWLAHAFVTQAHVEYAMPATAALLLAVVSFARDSGVEHRARTSIVCAVVFLGAWFPALRDAVGNQGGNLRQLVAFFLHPSVARDPNRWRIALGGVLSPPGAVDRDGPSLARVLIVAGVALAVPVVHAGVRRAEKSRLLAASFLASEVQLGVAIVALWRLPGEPHWYLTLWLKAVFFLYCTTLAMAWLERTRVRFEMSHAEFSALGVVALAAAAQLPSILRRSSDVRARSVASAVGVLDCIEETSHVRAPLLALLDADAWRLGAGIAAYELERGRPPRLAEEERYRFGPAFAYEADPRARARLPTVYVAANPRHRTGSSSQVPRATIENEQSSDPTSSGRSIQVGTAGVDGAYVSVDADVELRRRSAQRYLEDGWRATEATGSGLMSAGAPGARLRVGLFPGLEHRLRVVARSDATGAQARLIVNETPLATLALGPALAGYSVVVPAEVVRPSTVVDVRFEPARPPDPNAPDGHDAAVAEFESIRFDAVLPARCARQGASLARH